MRESLQNKLTSLTERHEEVSALLGDPSIIANQNKFRDLSREYSQLEPVVRCFQEYNEALQNISSMKELLEDDDVEMRAMAQTELAISEAKILDLTKQLEIHLLPKDPNDHRNIFLEVRAGTGGDEAALFAGNLVRMYMRYAEKKKWQTELISVSNGDYGGYKEAVIRIVGSDVYANLKFESGCHRVQRVPDTESQGRVHTSACTVAVMPEAEEIDAIDINPSDLKVDTYRSSGAGGQHVNTTDSAVRITHIPTGIVVECQDERSQHKNKARALSLLQAKILSEQQDQQQQDISQTRRLLVGSGDRSQRIRTYNFPQGRVTDHRINLTLYKLSEVMAGEVDLLTEQLIQEHQADLFASLANE